MAKVKPLPEAAAASSPSASPSQQQGEQKPAVYTVWMKSLVFNGNGCTVYGADGCVAYRVDNYGCRGGREVFFMDRAGNNLIRIQRKEMGSLPVLRRRRRDAAVVQSAQDLEERRRGGDAWQREEQGVQNRRVLAQVRLQDQRRRRLDRGGDRAEADGVRGRARRGRSNADSGTGGGSSARSGFGGRVWPNQPLLVMGTAAANQGGKLFFVWRGFSKVV
ncbi:protein LURP-one-related 11-like isoform X1 [Panicum hallii]|jgi:hypothetical protein|uniref:protein LURP-one-related 11-like isoform X1 n=1 Tax=Panicum hallii TaxID=206008 RepID=UPI000DF4D94B|nr:protein LURP-one-related 11-like isoform X1 [Panicum hallii]